MDTPAVLIEDPKYRVDLILQSLIGKEIKKVFYICNEAFFPRCLRTKIHYEFELGEFIMGSGEVYRFYDSLTLFGPTFFTLLLSPPNSYVFNEGFPDHYLKQSARLEISRLESWSVYLGKEIVAISIGWNCEDWGGRGNPESETGCWKAVGWIQIQFIDNLQVLIVQGAPIPVEVINSFKTSGRAFEWFTFHPEEMAIVFDQELANEIIDHWKVMPWNTHGEITYITKDNITWSKAR